MRFCRTPAVHFASAPIFGGITEMKYLLRVLFVLSLVCGCASHARAQGLNFHSTVLDPPPTCFTDTFCLINDTEPFTAVFSTAQCNELRLPNITDDDGCFFGVNATGEAITSLSLVFSDTTGLGTLTCDSASNPTGLPSAIFSVASCTPIGPTYTLLFTGGVLEPGQAFTLFEDGAPPADLGTDTAALISTPEPDSLLLLATGAMMMTAGLYLTKRRRLSAVAKK
jgi:hypothetical protein